MTLPLFQIPLPAELIIQGMRCEPMFRNTQPVVFPDGFSTITENADPLWMLNINAPYADLSTASRLRAWKAGLRGGQKTFVCPYAIQPFPCSYADKATVLALTRAGGGTFDGTTTVQSFPTPNEIAFTAAATPRLPGSFALKAGDVISIIKSGARPKYSLHMICEDVTATGGGVVTITVEPRVKTNIFAPGDIVNFVDQLGEFVLNPSTQSDGIVSRADNSFQLEATSYLRA